MSILSSFTRGSRLQAAIKTVAQARKSDGGKADQLYLKAYAEFADVIAGDLVLAQSLYNWGFALLQQARTKSGDAAITLYEQAIEKFAFCATVDPNFLGAAIDGGVAYMELARLKAVKVDDALYQAAKSHFERAEKIHKGTAIYNLACMHALMGQEEDCLAQLKSAVQHGCLPSEADVLADPDLDKVKQRDWFVAFIASLKQPEPAPEAPVAAEAPASDETLATEAAPVIAAEPAAAAPELSEEPAVVTEASESASDAETPASVETEQPVATSTEPVIRSEHYKL